jgi:hypothetical protein
MLQLLCGPVRAIDRGTSRTIKALDHDLTC